MEKKQNRGLNIAGDVWFYDAELLKQEALNFFKNLSVSSNPLQLNVGTILAGNPLDSEAKNYLLRKSLKRRYGKH